jgi:hypothetical protein
MGRVKSYSGSSLPDENLSASLDASFERRRSGKRSVSAARLERRSVEVANVRSRDAELSAGLEVVAVGCSMHWVGLWLRNAPPAPSIAWSPEPIDCGDMIAKLVATARG